MPPTTSVNKRCYRHQATTWQPPGAGVLRKLRMKTKNAGHLAVNCRRHARLCTQETGWEDTGHWPQIDEVLLKGMTAVSPDFASSHTERTSLVAQMVKASAYNAGDLGFIPGLGRWPGEGNGSPLQYSCLENPTDRGDWQATVHGVTKSRTRLNDFTFTFIHRKGLISLTWDIWFSLIINNLLMFWLPALCCKNSQTSWLFKAVPQSDLRLLSPGLKVLRKSA